MNSLSPVAKSLIGRTSRLAKQPALPSTASSHTPRLFSQACRAGRAQHPIRSGRSCTPAAGPQTARNEVRSYSCAPSASIKDLEHETGLWYHPLPGAASGSTRYAVSYLSRSPSSAEAKDVIATFDAPSSNNDPAKFARQNPDRVTANKPFWDLLHETLKEDIVAGERDAILVQEADLREDGWAHLADQRQLLMPGRIPTPDAIIASVSFANCKISPDTYEPNDTHRPITREEGWTVLRDVWLDALKARLKRQ